MERQGEPHQISHLCGKEAGTRDCPGRQPRGSKSTATCPESGSQESSSQAQVHCSELNNRSSMDSSGGGLHRDGIRGGDDSQCHSHDRHGGKAAVGSSGECGHESKDGWFGDGDPRAGEPCEGHVSEAGKVECEAEEVDDDCLDFVFVAPINENMSYAHKISRLVASFMKEYDLASGKKSMLRSSKLDLFEVMFHDRSELTHQAECCCLRARCFDITTTDLSTMEDRHILFCALHQQKPEHVRYSPECGPWSLWSNLNMNKSIAMEEKILQDR